MATELKIRQDDSAGPAVVLSVKVVPGSSRTKVAGIYDGMLKVKISAAPEKGKANKSLIEFLAGQLGIRKKDIEIVSGQTSPVKQLRISGVSIQEATDALTGA